ncbi:MAG: DUF4974 domain-containing protein [Bacteroidota bacterium]|nr:DUF4974 domain-containing protein [Bacteroidota bacterium]
MNESGRIGILLYLYTREELSPAEQEELRAWRSRDPENEKLFFQMTDPVSLRALMQAYYAERDRDFEKLKMRVPSLSETRLSGSVEETAKIFSEAPVLEEDDDLNASGADYTASGLSPVEYWSSMISCLDDAEETDQSAGTEKETVSGAGKVKSLRVRRKGRRLRIFLRMTGIVILLIVGSLFLPGSKYKNYKAEMISSDGVRIAIDDFHRGFLAGKAGIKFGETDKGEPIYIAANKHKAKKDAFYTLITPPAGMFILQFPEGTRIWLNAASTIQYPANFDQDTIRIEMEGEAYFEMSGDSTHHFLIRPATGNPASPGYGGQSGHRSTVSVKNSAALNINSYRGNREQLLTLVRGVAVLNRDTTENNLHLLSGQGAVIRNDSLALIRDVDTTAIIAWKNGEIYYKDAGLPVIMPAMAKWYDVDIQYAGGFIPDKKFSLRMPRSAALSEVLDSLQKQGLHFTRQGKMITIWK